MSDEPNPWQTLSSREIYRNPWIKVREDAVIRPDGQNGIYGVVSMRNHSVYRWCGALRFQSLRARRQL